MKTSVVSGVVSGVLLALAPAVAHAAVVAEWRMDEKAGATTMVDSAPSVGGANNGTRVVNVTTGVAPLVSGFAYQFGGTSSYVQVPHHSSLNPGSKTIALAATVKISNQPMADDSYDLVRKGVTTTSGGHYKMEILRSSKDATVGNLHCRFKIVTSGGTQVSVSAISPVDVANGAKHAVRCLRSGTTVRAIVDGKATSASGPAGWIANGSPVFVGAKQPTDDVLQGVLDQVSISIG